MNGNILQPNLLNINVGGLNYTLKIRTEDGSALKATSALLVQSDDSTLSAFRMC